MRNSSKFAVLLASAAMLTVGAASIVSAKGWIQQGGSWYYQNGDGDLVTDSIQSSGTSKFYLGEDGAMVTDYFLEDYGNGADCYYFGANGAMVTNTWVAIDPSVVSAQGDYIPDAYWYYFTGTGKAQKCTSGATAGLKKVTIDGKKYAFNENGQMLTGWIDDQGAVIGDDEEYPYENAVYYGGADNDGVLHSGWLAYYDSMNQPYDESDREFIYLWFNPANNRKYGKDADGSETESSYTSSTDHDSIQYITKKINGKTYAFEVGKGVMLVKWEGYNNKITTSSITLDNGNAGTKINPASPWYFSAEDDGHRVQKGWVYAVPAVDVSKKDYDDDEEKYMYFQNNGDILRNKVKKINGKYYGFDTNGIMKTGLVAYAGGMFYAAFDEDNTRGDELRKADVYRDGDNLPHKFKDRKAEDANHKAQNYQLYGTPILDTGKRDKEEYPIAIYYFGADGARKTGNTNIDMADDTYVFGSNNSGAYQGVKSKKYYSNGLLCAASPDIRYGLYISSDSLAHKKVEYSNISDSKFVPLNQFEVINTSGAQVKGSNASKKDADGNYWLISKKSDLYAYDRDNRVVSHIASDMANRFIGVYSQDVKYNPGREVTDPLTKLPKVVSNTRAGIEYAETGWCFKADQIRGKSDGATEVKSNQWIDFGDVDATGRTCSLVRGEGDYQVKIETNNDYALNFFWSGAKDLAADAHTNTDTDTDE